MSRHDLVADVQAETEALSARGIALRELHYAGKISADLFAEEAASLGARIQTVEAFEEVARLLAGLDIDEIWREATG